MRSGIGEMYTEEDGSVNFDKLCCAVGISWYEKIYGNSFHGISNFTEPFGCDTWEDGITPKIKIHLSGCSHNGDYHLIAFDYKNGNFDNSLGDDSPSFKSLLLQLFLVEGRPPEKFNYTGTESILSLCLDIICDVYDIPGRLQNNLTPNGHQISLVRDNKSGLMTTILSSGHATIAERAIVYSLYGLKALPASITSKSKRLFRTPKFGETLVVHSLNSNVYEGWPGLLCDDKYSPLVHFRIRQYPTDFHVVAWEKTEAIQDNYQKLCGATLYVVEGNNSNIFRVYGDIDRILCVELCYSVMLGRDIAIHDIYFKNIAGISIGGDDDGCKINLATYNDVEIRDATPEERNNLKKLFPKLFVKTSLPQQNNDSQSRTTYNPGETLPIEEINSRLEKMNKTNKDITMTLCAEPFYYPSKFWRDGRYLCLGFVCRCTDLGEESNYSFHLLLTTIPPTSSNRLAVDFFVRVPAYENEDGCLITDNPSQPVRFDGKDELVDSEGYKWQVTSFHERLTLSSEENAFVDTYFSILLKSANAVPSSISEKKTSKKANLTPAKQNTSWSAETKKEVSDFYCSYRRNHNGIDKTLNVFNGFRKAKPKSLITTEDAFKRCVETCKKTKNPEGQYYIGLFKQRPLKKKVAGKHCQ